MLYMPWTEQSVKHGPSTYSINRKEVPIDKPTNPFAWVDEIPAVVVSRKCRANHWRGTVRYENYELDCAAAKAKGADKHLEAIERTVD